MSGLFPSRQDIFVFEFLGLLLFLCLKCNATVIITHKKQYSYHEFCFETDDKKI